MIGIAKVCLNKDMAIISPGFQGRGASDDDLPPGQYLVRDWPVLTYGPTPQISTTDWSLSIEGLVKRPLELNWQHRYSLRHPLEQTWNRLARRLARYLFSQS
jgi:DMSO/TMAO reductase YedYZ molybdopterin-dependent catalytic subunit